MPDSYSTLDWIYEKVYDHTILSIGIISLALGKAYNAFTGNRVWPLIQSLLKPVEATNFRALTAVLLVIFLIILLILEKRISSLEAELYA